MMKQLNHWQQLTICCALCERSMPNYELFCELEDKADNALAARKILNKVWEFVRGQLNSLKNIEKQSLLLPDLMPSDEESFGALAAMDTIIALQSCIQSILDDSILEAANIESLLHDRLTQMLELQGEDPAQNPLVKRHEQFIQICHQAVSQQKTHAEVIKTLIPLSKDDGVSHLGISLE